MYPKRILLFLAGAITGAGITYLIASGKGRKATSKVIAMGMKLKEDAAILLESAKEDFDDMMAEATANKGNQIASKK